MQRSKASLKNNFREAFAQPWYSWLGTRHQSYRAGFDSQQGHTEDLQNGACSLSSLVFDVDGWVEWKGSRAELQLTRHQRNIHCGSSRVKTEVAPQTTREQGRNEVSWRSGQEARFAAP